MTPTYVVVGLLGATLLAASSRGAGPGEPAEPGTPDCSICHSTSDWKQVTFDHETTRLPLRGRHAQLACAACHADRTRLRLDIRCGACHADPHAGRLGQWCERCHETTSFRDGAGVAAHTQTRFPLYGRHAMVPCEQCHQARAERSYRGAPVACVACHRNDVQRTIGTPLDHVRAGLSDDCRACHQPMAWQRGALPEHDRCFPITRGDHRGIACLECHTTLPTLRVQSCTTFTAACTGCHQCGRTDGEHRGVAGYQCADRKCYECHPSGAGD